ncbi:MAG: PadR family transcriptional regulator, partial [Propionicimonas sp.]
TLYPLLDRLERDGLVAVEWRPGDGGPGRKYFALTAAGRAHARQQVADWAEFTTTTRALTDSARTEKGAPQ